MYIPDPIELIEIAIENEMSKVTTDETYPCIGCGTQTPLGDVITISSAPYAPGICPKCFDEDYGENLNV